MDKANFISSSDKASNLADEGTALDMMYLGFSGESDDGPLDNWKLLMERHVLTVWAVC